MSVALPPPATAMSGPECSAETRHAAWLPPELLSREKRRLRNFQNLVFLMLLG
jgi:hypothetical protein